MRSLFRLPARLRADRRGAAAVEFGILAPVAFLLLFALIDLGRLGFVMATLDYAAQEGAQFASLHGTDSAAPTDKAAVEGRVRALIYGVDPAAVAVEIAPSVPQSGSPITVSARYSFSFLANLLPLPSIALQGESRMMVL